jgi:aspartyl-tRNA(Asn)/glutamyl-tRNA(Gln) amidotransferase subunit A
MSSAPTAIHDLTAIDLRRLYRVGELSPVEVVADVLARIERLNPIVNAFLLIDSEGALAAARAAEQRWARGEPIGRVDGVPATVKDNIWAKGWPTRRGRGCARRGRSFWARPRCPSTAGSASATAR